MKISFLIPSLRKGGAERQFILVAEEMTKCGHTVEFITYKQEESFYPVIVKTIYISKKRKIDLVFLISLVRYLKNNETEILCSCYQGIFEGPLLWARMVKIFYSKVKVYSCFRSPYFSNAGKLVEKLTSNLSAMLLTNNKAAKNILINSIGVNKRKVKLINNIADNDNFYPLTINKKLELRQKFFNKSNKQIFAVIGSYIPVKNQLFILKTIKYLLGQTEINSFYFSFFGDANGFNSTYDKCLAYQKGNNIESYSELNTSIENVNELLNAIDALIVPSLYEGSPNIVMEAILCKIPVIISKSANQSKLILNGINGFEYDTGNMHDLLRCIKKVKTNFFDFDHETLKQNMLKFDKRKIINQYSDVFTNL